MFLKRKKLKKNIHKVIGVCFTLMLLLASCKTLPSIKDNPEGNYKKDLVIQTAERAGIGTVVLPYKQSYTIKISSAYSMDTLIINTCHRNIQIESETRSEKVRSYFGRVFKVQNTPKENGSKTFTYTPVEAIEKSKYGCRMSIRSFSKVTGRFSEGFVEFEHPALTLKAKLKCNGFKSTRTGVGICESKSGLEQGLVFPRKVFYKKSNDRCAPMKSDDKLSFFYNISERTCTYTFLTQQGKEEFFRLTSIGYDERKIKQ